MRDQHFEALLSSRGYALGETEEHYGICHRRARGEPLERFPLTAEGFDAAKARFRELTRRRRDPERVRRALWWIVLVGVTMWVAETLFSAVVYGTTLTGIVPRVVAQIAFALGAVGYRLAVGGLFVLAALFLVRNDTRPRVASTDTPESPPRGWETIAWWAASLGLGIWIVSVLATRTLAPDDPALFLFEGRPPRPLYLAASLIEGIAFRTWVAAAVLLALARLYGLRRLRP